MARAIGDPEELQQFARSLQQFFDSLVDAVGNLNCAFATLGDTWRKSNSDQDLRRITTISSNSPWAMIFFAF